MPKPTGEVCEQGAILASQGEQNHFDPHYRVPREKWTMPRLDLQSKAFQCARNAFAASGGTIYNAFRKTALDLFPFVDCENIRFTELPDVKS